MEFEAPNEPMEIHVQSQSINISIIDCGRRKTARKSFQNHQHPKVHAIFTMCFLLFEPFFSGEAFPPGRSARPITVRSTCNYYPSNLCVLDLAISFYITLWASTMAMANPPVIGAFPAGHA